MKKAAWIFTLTIIAFLLTSAPVSMAVPQGVPPGVGPGNPVPTFHLSPFINIWLDNVGNGSPEVAYNSRRGEYLVVWENYRGGGATIDIYARRVRADGKLLSYFTIVHNANFWNYDPAIAYNPQADEYLVVYTYDSVITDSDIYARRVRWNGSWMSNEIKIGRPDKSGKQVHPAVAYNSDAEEYLVVYENAWGSSLYDIDAQRVASDGSLLSWRNIATGGGQFRRYPDVAFSPATNEYLIAYNFHPNPSATSGDIYAKVTSWNMGYLSHEIHICDDAHNQTAVSLSASMDEFIAVWEDAPNSTTTEIYARRLAPDGTPLGPGGGFWIAGSPNVGDLAPDIAYGPGYGYLVTWFRHKGGYSNVFGRYIMPGRDNGSGSEFAIDNDVKDQLEPGVACATVGDCLVVEMDNNSLGNDFEIRGRMVFPDHVYLPLTLKGQ